MRKALFFLLIALLAVSCKETKTPPPAPQTESEQSDSTLYGICGEGTMMNTLQLITSMHDTLTLSLLPLDEEDEADDEVVVGGLSCGDRLAATAVATTDGDLRATKVINITSMLGRWSNIDKVFEMKDEGDVLSSVKPEEGGWTAWRILNGRLLLNRDTFDIITLDADTMELENSRGIFLYRRVRAAASEEVAQ